MLLKRLANKISCCLSCDGLVVDGQMFLGWGRCFALNVILWSFYTEHTLNVNTQHSFHIFFRRILQVTVQRRNDWSRQSLLIPPSKSAAFSIARDAHNLSFWSRTQQWRSSWREGFELSLEPRSSSINKFNRCRAIQQHSSHGHKWLWQHSFSNYQHRNDVNHIDTNDDGQY